MTAPAAAGLNADALARLGASLQRLVTAKRLPGAVWMIRRRGVTGCFERVGQQDPARGLAMHEDTIFRIYSMTKPVVSVALMRLVEAGRLQLRDPVAKHLPEFAGVQLGVERDAELLLVAPRRPPTIHDLLRHTAGLTYEFLEAAPVRRRYIEADLFSRQRSNAEHIGVLAGLPLMHEPGSIWEYSRATDVLGRVLEKLSGTTLGEHLQAAVFGPLGMVDTGFALPPEKHARFAEAFAIDPDSGAPTGMFDPRPPVPMQNGGGGLLSTAADYARFLQMLLSAGTHEGARLLGRKTVEFMTADHVAHLPRSGDLLPPDHGFGLGVAVKTRLGGATEPGSVGSYGWSGAAGTTFFVDPQEDMFALLMVQAPGQFDELRELFRLGVYAAIDD